MLGGALGTSFKGMLSDANVHPLLDGCDDIIHDIHNYSLRQDSKVLPQRKCNLLVPAGWRLLDVCCLAFRLHSVLFTSQLRSTLNALFRSLQPKRRRMPLQENRANQVICTGISQITLGCCVFTLSFILSKREDDLGFIFQIGVQYWAALPVSNFIFNYMFKTSTFILKLQ